jgi:hypothetical protein
MWGCQDAQIDKKSVLLCKGDEQEKGAAGCFQMKQIKTK